MLIIYNKIFHKNNKPDPPKSRAGFTLIELLVVIAIIGLLASVILIALSDARQKARVATRVADLNQITKALELYYADNGSYPNTFGTSGTSAQSPGLPAWASLCTQWSGVLLNGVIQDLVPKYLARFPSDPSMIQPAQNCYGYSGNTTDYKIIDYDVVDMTLQQINSHPELVDPCRGPNAGTCVFNDGSLSWSLSTPGARWW